MAVKQRSGFTLFELVVVVAMVLILTGMAVPALQDAVARDRVQTAALQLAQDLRLVRDNTITYQSDLYAYVSPDAAVNGCYYYEKLPHLGTNGLPDGAHNAPVADGQSLPDPGRFVRKAIPFNLHILSISSAASSVAYGGHQYYEIRFRSGKGAEATVVPGSAEVAVTVVIGTSGGLCWRVVVDSIGRTHLSQQ